MTIPRYLGGNTVSFRWISSGQSPTTIYTTVLDGSDTMVTSCAMTDSGNGHYYANITLPSTPGFYVREDVATISSLPYKKRKRMLVVPQEVD